VVESTLRRKGEEEAEIAVENRANVCRLDAGTMVNDALDRVQRVRANLSTERRRRKCSRFLGLAHPLPS
jgi:hypothetical protein